jgi:hypothetical protein
MPKVYSFDATTKILSGESDAMESPAEPGVFLLPAFSTFLAPPVIPTGKTAVWEATHWLIVDIPPMATEAVIIGWLATDREKHTLLTKIATDQMDMAARAVGFDSIADAVASVPGTPTNQAGRDAATLKDWRLAVISRINEVIATVRGNHNPMPAVADIVNSFPKWTRNIPDPTVGSTPDVIHEPHDPPPPPYVPPPPPPVFPDVHFPVTPPDGAVT